MEKLLAVLLGLQLVKGLGHWCHHRVEQLVERVLSPRQQLEVGCSQVYQYNTQGWRLDVDRMRVRHGGDDGIALYYQQKGPGASCSLYKPPEIESQRVNKTVQGCCEGWGGPHCSQGTGVRGHCFSTWSCEDFPGVHNASLMSMEQCCSGSWALSWRNASDRACLSCTYTLLPDSQSSLLVRGGLLGSTRAPQGSATCVTWGGAHFRSFDRKHFHFRGSCTYLLAASTDGTWAVYVSTVCEGGGDCSKALRMMLGLDLVSVRLRNLTLNNILVAQGEPRFQNGVSVHWLGDFVFVESGLGVRVKFDLNNTVYLTVTAEHMATTRGLCGLYNNNADDDFTTVTGALSQYAASFGNSWRVPDPQNQGCSDAAELGHSCDITEDAALRRQAESECRRLLESPFSQCHRRVDPAAYLDTCLYLYCSLGPRERAAAVCDTLASYARECAQQQVITVWRTAALCGRVCPRGQVFSDCVSSCPPSCTAPQPPGQAAALGQCREECVGGCECPPGLYLHQGLCMKRVDCPCFHRRLTYQPGATIQKQCNTCVCKEGQWQCSGERCAAQCMLMGALQITTFDRKRYSLQGGACSFTAVEDFVDRKLVVSMRCGECDSSVGGGRGGRGGGGEGCLKELSITALRTTVTITHTGTVTLNGQREALPVVTADLAVRRASSSFLMVQTFGAQLLWHLDGPLALITLQPGFAHKVRGLCGTLTWNQHDDFTTPEGDVETGVSAFAAKFTAERCTLPAGGPAAQDPCTTYTQRRHHADTMCSIIHSPVFQACHDVVEREPYLRLCQSEVCGCDQQGACHCTVLTAYARHCAQEGVAIPWRNHTFCPVQCSGGKEYQECGRACGGSCSDRQQGWSCDEDEEEDDGDGGGGGKGGARTSQSCVPGCQCAPGLAEDALGQCVPLAMCPCVQGGRTFQPGATVQINCNTCLCELGRLNCTSRRCEEVNRCPGSLVYSPRSCLLSCSSLDPPGQQQGVSAPPGCLEPLAGCVCPQGAVLLGERCVPPEECPCHHNGRLYYTNDTITKDCNTCVCKDRRWLCGQAACGGVCVATGDPHYVTFDGRCFSFLGDCQYVLARETDGLFSVTAENVPCGSTGVTCTKSVTLSLGNTVIHLLRGKAVTVNGMPVTLPRSYSGSGLTLERVGLFVSLSSRLGVTLLWDGGMRVYVRLAARLRGRVGGLCGNFDGDTENDFTTRQGIMESTAELFGNSWKVSPSCPDVADQDLRDPCALNPHRVPWARRRCGLLTQELFSPCHPEVPFQQFYDWCVFDACGCDSGGDCECLCTALAAYAEECNRRGVYIRWRSQELCPLQCDNGLEYEPCGPACPSSCPSRGPCSESSGGALYCVEGCFCPPGTVQNGDGCVTRSQCPCQWEGSMFPPGASVTQHCQNCTCEDGVWGCGGAACPPPSPLCEEGEFRCAGGRCVPPQWLCDNEDDCGDGSDEVCPSTCGPDQFRCVGTPSGPCLAQALRCDGHLDCVDQSDEEFCGPATAVPRCPPGEFQCANGKCLPSNRVCDGRLDCGFADASDEQDCGVVCGEGEFLCAGGRCILYIHRCDGHDDCGDLSDERGCVCSPGEMQCPGGQCVPADRVCDGHRDCPSGSDEALCPSRVTCAPGQFSCSDGTCLDAANLCDGVEDCLGAEDENAHNCRSVAMATTPTPARPTPTVTSLACRSNEFGCVSVGQCVPMAWRCDGETDCMDGSDEDSCPAGPCGPGQVSCLSGGQCVDYRRLCDGVPHCADASDENVDNCGSTRIPPCPGSFSCDNHTCVNASQVCNGVPDCPRGDDELLCDKATPPAPPGDRNTSRSCPEFSCWDGSCVSFNAVCNGVVDCPDPSLPPPPGGPSDEQHCRTWSPWGPWGLCSTTCGTGSMSRQRTCPPGDPLRRCRGQGVQRQQCFNTTCPVDGRWLPWVSWSNCSRGCGGVEVRHRGCAPPRFGGAACALLPGESNLAMEIKPCPENGTCVNRTCPAGLVRHSCGPCPLSCSHISTGTPCRPDDHCFSGCWCPEGRVMSPTQLCVAPGECPCEVGGARYWPGQQVKVDCEVCVCEGGRPQRCQHNTECSVHCEWSSWSEWGECLGPCGVQSVQWSFRSPNNPVKHGDGRTCRGIYRKARRCQTDPCEECEHQGQSHAVGDVWGADTCQLCHCLANLMVKCSPYCPYAATGCLSVNMDTPAHTLICMLPHVGNNATVSQTTISPFAVPSTPTGGATTSVPTYPISPGSECWAPLGVQSLPTSSFRASSQQPAHPAGAARLYGWDPHTDLQGWSPEPEEYRDLPQRNPEDRDGPRRNPYLQIDLLQPYNITGVLTQGGGVFDTYVSSFYLQFSQSGGQWYTYRELLADARPRAKVFGGNRDDRGVAEVRLDRMVSARLVRFLPHEFQNAVYLRLEIMGCGEGTLPPSSCPAGQFSCPPPVGCIPAAQRCDGTPHCASGEDERGCHPYHQSTTQSDSPTPAPLRTPSTAAVSRPAVTPTDGTPGHRGVCSSALGLEDGRIRYGQMTSSTHRENNPADAGRLNIVPNVLIMEPGWSPLASDPQPYLQVDFLEPTWVSGVVTQGSQRMWGYLTRYQLAFALHSSLFSDYTETGAPGSPAKVFEVRMVGQAPVTRWLGRLVRARYLRIIPLEFRHTFYLRAEILGCRGGTATATVGSPGLQNLTSSTGRPGFRGDATTGAPGLYSTRPHGGRPGVATTPTTPRFTGQPGLHDQSTPAWVSTTPHDGGLPRVLCVEGQFACASFGCVDAAQVCDGHRDCFDGSDEEPCGSTARPAVSTVRPLVPSPCSAKQFSCASGECVHLDRRCDLHRDCVDGSDELHCVDCITSPWTTWSRCSVSCGLGSLFRQRDVLREALPGGACDGAQFDSRACFPRACPADGHWSEWSAWSECDAPCGGGVRRRRRSCSAPPPKNGGRDCEGMTLQTQSCNVPPCGTGTDTQSGCAHGMVLVTEADCLAGRVEDCPPTCSHLSQPSTCTTSCVRGCRCPGGLYLQGGRCVSASQCGCVWDGDTLQPGQNVSRDLCTTCMCRNGQVTCDNSSCVASCDWSGWSSWSPCDVTCGAGIQQRFRGPMCPPRSLAHHGGPADAPPCQGDSTEARQCFRPCLPGTLPQAPLLLNTWAPLLGLQTLRPVGPTAEGRWTRWTAWSECSSTCFQSVDQVGLRQRFRTCHRADPPAGPPRGHALGHAPGHAPGRAPADLHPTMLGSNHTDPPLACSGEGQEQEPCNTVQCPVTGGWSLWSSWSQCSAECDSGVQTRGRLCSSPPPQHGGSTCPGPHIQTRDCNSVPCSGMCPEGMLFLSEAECAARGGACPRACLDMTSAEVQCATRCYDGCHCAPGFYLLNGSCVARASCPCYHQGALHPAGAVLPADACNNCTCLDGEMHCGAEPCPVDCGWSVWTQWSACSRTCDVGVRRRFRSGTDPPAVFGGRPCRGDRVGMDTCSIEPCFSEWSPRFPPPLQCRPPPVSSPPIHGSWGPWAPWSECDACDGATSRTRECSSPPARFGGLPCHGVSRQRRGCHDNHTVCSDCGGGQEDWPCGKPCPRSCSDLHGDTECVDSADCSRTCGCPGDQVLQDGVCAPREECRCKYHDGTSAGGNDASNASWVWPGPSDWLYIKPGETITSDCKNCSCEAGVLQCQTVDGCLVDGGWSQWAAWSECSLPCGGGAKVRHRQCDSPAPQSGGRGCVGQAEQQKDCNAHTCTAGGWLPWSPWSPCSVSCGGGEQYRTRRCASPPCSGLPRQSKTCNTQVCLEVGCPPGRLYRECERGEDCPFSCSQVSGREACYSDGCEEGCHCPPHTYQHHGVCLQECPCLVDAELLTSIESVSVTPVSSLLLYNVSEGAELLPGSTLQHDCSSCSCEHGLWNCSLAHCPLDGGLSTWGPWSPCSLSCGGLGLKSRSRGCTQPPPAHGGRDCQGARQETTYCQAPDCPVIIGPTDAPTTPDEDAGFSLWSAWSPCTRTCSDPHTPTIKTRQRRCVRPPCSGPSHQEKACNLPQCPDGGDVCTGEACESKNCSWTGWGGWGSCSRSCGVGQQLRLRTFMSPGANGSWCPDILDGNQEQRFCNIRPCRVDGGWSRWSPWSRCDKLCGGGRAVRTRSCSSPPPKNGGLKCEGEKNQVKPCSTKPCGEKGCPPGQEVVLCANQCPQRCADLQQGIECHGNAECQPGCRCPKGALQQDGVCVQLWQCDCVDSLGQTWAAGSSHQVSCNNCSCSDGQLLCTNHSCEDACSWSSWSNWASCSTSCGRGQRTRYRSLIPETPGANCQFEEVQHKSCDPGLCPRLCVHDDQDLRVGDTWLQGECQQCTCTPEGEYCQEIDCRVDGGWTPWSVWSDCPVTCGRGAQVRSRACVNPPPRNNGSHCGGPDRESRDCRGPACLDDLCPWSPWSPCSRSCGAGSVWRRRGCVCEEAGDAACPPSVEEERGREETQLCYRRPCPGCPMSEWSEWSQCSCVSQRQQRHRVALSPATRGQQCSPVETQSRACNLTQCDSCDAPFVYSECGAPCEKQCALRGRSELCLGVRGCTPGCYCPQGLLQHNGSCVPPEDCGCVHLQQHSPDQPPTPITVPQGETLTVGCSTCFCHEGTLQCDMRQCEVILSEWSAWTPCSPCKPSPAGPLGAMDPGAVGPGLVSLQRRYRACLDLDSGLPVSEEEQQSQCPGPLSEERACPDPTVCRDVCAWRVWGAWGSCTEPCSGGIRQRHRQPLTPSPGPHCRSQQTQSQSCNTGLCPGERCEDRGRTYQEGCANQCPRSCADLWEHVQCLQGACHSGCRCPAGQLLQDGECVPLTECRCGVPSGNGTLEFSPGGNATLDCNTCVCENSSLVCTKHLCPVYQPWSQWSACSASCGRGQRMRTRPCQKQEGGPPCGDTEQTDSCLQPACPAGCELSEWSSWSECSASCGGGVSVRNKTLVQAPEPGGLACTTPLEQHIVCNTNSCMPECPRGEVFSVCAGSCPYTCEDLWPQSQCVAGPCTPGCTCPPGQVLYGGSCVSRDDCPCSPLALLRGNNDLNASTEESGPEAPVPPGSTIKHLCNICVCEGGVLNCTSDTCDVDCEWSSWSPWSSCSASCGSGQRRSNRTVLRPNQYNGAPCEGPSQHTAPCLAPDCACPAGEQWRRRAPEGPVVCERSCEEMYVSSPANCSAGTEGCVCRDGRYRSATGACVLPALCPCEDGSGLPREAGVAWEEGCVWCRCVNGVKQCQSRCPALSCDEGEVKVLEPGNCCPVCRKLFPGQCLAVCQRYTQVRNITKGGCRLDNVEVSFCRGRCLSRADVILEEPYLQSVCECCSYRLDPDNPVRFLSLQCASGDSEPVVLPVIHSCECTSCQGGDLSRR
ncbi:unnamed protein product [Lota lota]